MAYSFGGKTIGANFICSDSKRNSGARCNNDYTCSTLPARFHVEATLHFVFQLMSYLCCLIRCVTLVHIIFLNSSPSTEFAHRYATVTTVPVIYEVESINQGISLRSTLSFLIDYGYVTRKSC